MARHTMVRIEIELLEELREYSRKTGVPIVFVVKEAVSKWLQEVAPKKLKALGK